MAKFSIIGLMSGTSVDGLDIAYCTFTPKYGFKIVKAQTIEYPIQLKLLLVNNLKLDNNQLFELDAYLGKFFGESVKVFLNHFNLPPPKAIASHGHTVLHNPAKGYTVQIGKGSAIAAQTGLPVVCDFRSSDVSYGGQGAPLVPIGDKLLFSEYDYCLNLGGFANISYQSGTARIAYDIGPCNLPANMIMSLFFGRSFDRNGERGKQGKILPKLLQQLDNMPYYRKKPPKSLGREWVEKKLMPILKREGHWDDVLRTYYEHIAGKIAIAIEKEKGRVLVTGGGVHNSFLIDLIKQKTKAEIVLPNKTLIDFKEALIFAFLGYLRIHQKTNVMKTVTGAKKDNIGGCIYLP